MDQFDELVIGWVSSHYLSTGRSRVGYDPNDVPDLFEIHTDLAVQASGGRLLSVTSNWLEIRDGPTGDYAVVDAPEWGRVVRWTGDSIEQGGHTWYEVTHWIDTDVEGKLEAVSGWVRSDRVVDYAPPADAPAPEGAILVPLKEERSFSYYTVTDVDSYVPTADDPRHFNGSYQVNWANGVGPDLDVPYGSIFAGDGVAMQGSGKVTIAVFDPVTGDQVTDPVSGDPVTRVLYFELDNGTELDWINEQGNITTWEPGGWTHGNPAEIANPEDARFRPVSKAPDLISGVSVAGPPELRGRWIYAPELREFSPRGDGMFKVEDAGGAFPAGSLRIDVFYENADQGFEFYSNASGVRLGTPVYIDQRIPPPIEEDSG